MVSIQAAGVGTLYRAFSKDQGRQFIDRLRERGVVSVARAVALREAIDASNLPEKSPEGIVCLVVSISVSSRPVQSAGGSCVYLN